MEKNDNNDMYENPSSSSSSYYALQPPELNNSDEFSLFVHQILQRSSCPSATVAHTHTGATTQAAAAIVSSSSAGGLSECETDENDCQSKEGSEAFTEEMLGRPGSHRGSSKRSRAAEVHNMSEKRRRSRINEKMKALQNLIPNSNKTDKASMLDEAIEYLKQLQLQVQMLYMRNGLNLHTMCLPGVLQPINLPQMRMGSGEENQSLQFHTTGTRQENPRQNVLGQHNNVSLDQPSLPTVPNMFPEASYGPEFPSHSNLGPLQIHASTEGICREDMVSHQQTNIDHTGTHPLGFDRTMATGNLAPDHDITNSLEACFLGRSQSDGALLSNFQHSYIPQHFSRAYPTISRNTSTNVMKAEGRREL